MNLLTRRSVPLFALALLALAFVAAVALSSVALRGARLDLTQKQLYTLSPGTLAILGRTPCAGPPQTGIAAAKRPGRRATGRDPSSPDLPRRRPRDVHRAP